MATSNIQLKYDFIPSVNPILASATGANPNTMDLQVMISNPVDSPLSFSKITIQIPVGEDTAKSLSSALALPSPAQAASGDWKIAVSESMITLTPVATGASSAMVSTEAILFTLSSIVLPIAPGTVPITVTEFPCAGAKVADSATYSLAKLPNDFPVTNFYADPAFLSDVCSPLLYWVCSDAGSDYTYNLSSDSGWSSDGHSVQDGAGGVSADPTGQTTVYRLDILHTSAPGSSPVQYSLTLTVPSRIPNITNAQIETILGGNVAILRWLATGTDHCSIMLDGDVYAEKLPTDTYSSGYPVTVSGSGGASSQPHQLSVIAYNASESVSAEHAFSSIAALPPIIAPIPCAPGFIETAISNTVTKTVKGWAALLLGHNPLASNYAFLTGVSFEVCSLELDIDAGANTAAVTLGPNLDTQAVLKNALDVAYSADGNKAFITSSIAAQALGILDLQKGGITFPSIPGKQSNYNIPGTPESLNSSNFVTTADKKKLIFADADTGTLYQMDLASGTMTTLGQTAATPQKIAMTPDGNMILTIGAPPGSPGQISFFDLATNTALATVLTVASIPMYAGIATTVIPNPNEVSINFTSDGKYALVLFNSVTVVDMANRTAGYSAIYPGSIQVPLINIGPAFSSSPSTITMPVAGITAAGIWPGTYMGMFCQFGTASVTVFNIITGASASLPIAQGNGQSQLGIVVLPDGKRAIFFGCSSNDRTNGKITII